MSKLAHLITIIVLDTDHRLQYLGTTYLYSNGTYSWDTLHKNAFDNFKQFGPIVREDLLPGVTIVHLFNHQDIKTLFHSEVSAVKQQLSVQFIIIFLNEKYFLTIKIILEAFYILKFQN